MIAPAEAGQAADLMLTAYCRACQCATPDDVRSACEMMISKAGRAIEKYSGAEAALEVLQRTTMHLLPSEGTA